MLYAMTQVNIDNDLSKNMWCLAEIQIALPEHCV
jgi:hypothetical protein